MAEPTLSPSATDTEIADYLRTLSYTPAYERASYSALCAVVAREFAAACVAEAKAAAHAADLEEANTRQELHVTQDMLATAQAQLAEWRDAMTARFGDTMRAALLDPDEPDAWDLGVEGCEGDVLVETPTEAVRALDRLWSGASERLENAEAALAAARAEHTRLYEAVVSWCEMAESGAYSVQYVHKQMAQWASDFRATINEESAALAARPEVSHE